MKLGHNDVRWLWNSICYKIYGVDANGEEISDLTCVAGAALAMGVTISINTQDDYKSVAKFLRQWADALESE